MIPPPNHILLLLAQTGSNTPASGFRPFLTPLPIHDEWWLTLLPLAFLVSVAYKAVRVRAFDVYWKQVIIMTIQIVAAMIALAIAQHIFIEIIVPALASP